ncbi:hypothetical protein [Cognatiluteimonas profundi]|uniref:hypothetical protein n=1 Tax=Cognatiluteimonas profundi TaxID=2594501 RepID=UPI00131A937F|nr:hypothetical protein [Lysobacter profundi]
MSINETVLEMHFHHALMDLFRSTFGVGPAGRISFYKYSPQKECFVGFDQAWVMTDVSDDQLFNDLKDAAQGNSYNLGTRYVGYFLQYKVVKRMIRHSKNNPPPVTSAEYGRAAVSNQANANTGKSQHELLFNLCKNLGALTYYACPAIFDKAELYRESVDLNKLTLVDLSSCPSEFKDNQKHYIYFDFPSMKPTWCSEPVLGTSIDAIQMARSLERRLNQDQKIETDRLLSCLFYLNWQRRVQRGGRRVQEYEPDKDLDSALQALTVIRVDSRGRT